MRFRTYVPHYDTPEWAMLLPDDLREALQLFMPRRLRLDAFPLFARNLRPGACTM